MSGHISGGARFFLFTFLFLAGLSLIRFLVTESGGDRVLAGVSTIFFLAVASTIIIKPAWYVR